MLPVLSTSAILIEYARVVHHFRSAFTVALVASEIVYEDPPSPSQPSSSSRISSVAPSPQLGENRHTGESFATDRDSTNDLRSRGTRMIRSEHQALLVAVNISSMSLMNSIARELSMI